MKISFAITGLIILLFLGCTKTSDDPVILAEYTLGSGGPCTGAIVSGRFVADTALTVSNSVTITVNVALAGPYSITTNTVNGISFSQTGTFTSTGPQTVILKGTGMPTDIDTSDFILTPLSGPGGICTFLVPIVRGVPPAYYLTGIFNGIYKNFSDSAVATNSNTPGSSGLAGLSISGLDTILNSKEKIQLGVAGTDSISKGMYSDTGYSKTYFNYVDSLGQTWSVSNSGQPSFTIEVVNINEGYVNGTFSGIIKNQQASGTDSIVVANGVFLLPVN
jgi:hypothetical protein